MPSLRPKARGATSWLPNQVAYGIDCSDPEPANWKPFGYQVDEAQVDEHDGTRPAPSKADQRKLSAPVEP